MRNTSDPIKENSNVMNAQGGEKKVMKKILSVALSTAMAFSMFASVAFGDTAVSPQQQFDALKAKGVFTGYPDGTAGLDKEMTRAEFAKVITKLLGLKEITGVYSYNDKNYNAKNWAAPYIEAVTAAGIMEGKNVEKKIFDFNGKVTIEEMAKVLTIALDLEVPTETNNTATAWAKGYVQAAINAGLLDTSLNFQSNASRQLLVGAAYAIDQAQSLKVASYEVSEAGKVVTFKISDGESVKVTLDKALEANKETEVKFTYKDKEFTEKVTYVVTAATKVQSVSADNLKQVTVTFDGDVDAATAEDVNNYQLSKDIKSAVLSADKKTVVLTLDNEYYTGGNKLDNQKAIKLTVSGIKNSDGSKTIAQEVTFTPVDVTTPSVKEVKGLGTGAFQVVFSEPVDRASAITTSNYKVDGKVISGTVEYAFPDSVIITTGLTTGDHKLTVSNVQDFSGLKVVPVESDFAVAADTEAPTVTTAKSYDLQKVEIEFNEPIRSFTRVYNGTTAKTGEVTRSGNKLTVTFTRANALSVGENTIVIEGATDYSGNTATREVKVTPTLDTVKPAVSNVAVSTDNGNHVLKVKYGKSVYSSTNATGVTKANYTIKDKDGKVVVGYGLDGNGHPVKTITYDSNTNEAQIILSGYLPQGNYTVEVSGVQDNAYVPNTIVPSSTAITIGNTSTFEVNRFWSTTENTNGSKRDVSFFVTFSKAVATEGTGNALEKSKYALKWTTGATSFEALPSNATVELVTPETVKITVPYTDKVLDAADAKLRVSLVADQAGNFAYTGNSYVSGEIGVVGRAVSLVNDSVKATATNKITVKFNGVLNTVDANDFAVRVGTTNYNVVLDGQPTYSDGNTVVKFALTGDTKLNAAPVAKFGLKPSAANPTVAITPNTQDNLGVRVDVPVVSVGADLIDNIKPETVKFGDNEIQLVAGGAANEYVAKVKFNEEIDVVPGTNVVKLSVTGKTVSGVSYAKDTTDPTVLNVTFTTNTTVADDSVVTVELNSSNAASKVITDSSTEKNAAEAFSLSGVVQAIKSGF
ncbi:MULTISPECIES: S-layer homology domain-containing protein [unclassified Paenibacillus]|uniref:S-layer homology domain-containing protein n=1 Tax=unclassified Paenibacillus TaxID=185978 RepID=UPI0009A8D498|nr:MULTISPECIES: S-layer homology domain-containing protein [unclassified Paenibacillus]SLK06930.1 S-layer homology domain-containing protein [Paenibacillus sp. RU5A]SOC70685.1 S-layer homology domain-containing protein [Paenibacillus sp. RU26A]SOC72836.1 S-layer homology domain-containing protein [Paenibacillus sp. RU5M]